MSSKKHYSFDPRESSGYCNFTSGRDSERPTYTSNMFSAPKESKIERENYLTKEDSKRVSENVTKSVITRSVIDRRSSSCYRTREDRKSGSTTDPQEISGTDPSRFSLSVSFDENENENKAPVSSFYSSYAKDEDLNKETGISSFYRSSIGSERDGENAEHRLKANEENTNFTRASNHGASFAGVHAARGENWRSSGKTESSGSKRSLERNVTIKDTETKTDRGADDSRKITLDDVHILRRALERKQASNSLERERLSKKLSEDAHSDPSEHNSKAYLSHRERYSTADQHPKTRSSVSTTYDLGYRGNKRTGKDDVTDRLKKLEVAAERVGRQTRGSYSVEFPGKLSTRSRSLEQLHDKERSRLGIYQELPGREEILSYSRSLSNAATSRSEDKEVLREGTRSGSLDRRAGSMDNKGREDRNSGTSLLKLRSRSSEELRSLDKENDKYPSYRSHYLSRQGNFEHGDTFFRDVTNTRDTRRPSSQNKLREDIAKLKAETESRVTKKGDVKLYSFSREPSIVRETEPASHVKLREDIAKLKAEAESRKTKKDDIKLYSFSREPSIQDKLKEDIAKLKVETLTRDHGKPYIPPYSSRTESGNVSSRWRRREPSIQDKLKEDIAKLKAETRNFTRKAPATTEIIIPDRKRDESGNVRQSGLARTTIQRYHLSKKDGDVFKDELKREETQRYGKGDRDHEEAFTTRKYGAFEDKPVPRDDLKYSERDIRDEVFPEPSEEYSRPTRDQGASSMRRPSEEAPPTFFSRERDDKSSSWPTTDEGRLLERDDSLTFPRKVWEDPEQKSWEKRAGSVQGYASKKVFRADSTVSLSSTRDTEGGPSSVKGFFHGSVSEEDQSAYFSRQKGDKEDGYPQSTRIPESVRRPDVAVPEQFKRTVEDISEPVRQPDEAAQESARRPDGAIQEPGRRPNKAIPLPYTGYEIVTPRREEPISSSRESWDEPKPKDKEAREVHSERIHSSNEFVTRKTIRDSGISRESFQDKVSGSLTRGDNSRRFSKQSEPSTRRTSIREEVVASRGTRIPYPKEVVEPIPEYKDSKPSRISELRKKVEQLKSKVDSLDDTKSRMQLEKYVDEHSEKKPDVEIKDPVNIKRYQLSERRPERRSIVDAGDPLLKRSSIDFTSESMSRQISRQTSQTSTTRRISSILEEDLKAAPQTTAIDESPYEVFPKERKPEEKPAVMKQVSDAGTMTTPEIQEHVGGDLIRRQDSTLRETVDGPVRLQELRGVPIQQIGEVGTGQEIQSGVTTIQIDNQQQTLSPKKDVQGWWNASTAEDVDRLLELGNWSRWNTYTAEDVDRMFQLGPVRRRSIRRGSYERRSLRRYPRRSWDDHVDVHVRVRGRQEKQSRPQCIIAQAAPEEKAIVLRDTKESADPFIRKIKVDDVYGADAVRVENGIVKIKVGDLTSRGKRAWARILQQNSRIVESDGTVVIPVNQDHYKDGVYYTNYYQGQEQDGTVRIPITVKIQEQTKAKANKIRVAREMKRGGSMRRKRRTAGSRGYIVGARYYSGNLMLKSVDGYRTQGNQREVVLRQRQDGPKIASNEIVVRRSSQSTAFPMQTVQRIHEGHRTTSHAASVRDDGGKMVITVHAAPPQEPRFNLKQVGENMRRTSEMLTSGTYHRGTSNHRDVSNTSGNYYISSTSGGGGMSGAPRGYVTTSTSGRQGGQGTSYFVTDPSDSLDRRSGKSGYQGVTRVYTSNEVSSTPTIIPYDDNIHPSRRGTQLNDSFIADPSSIYGFYDAPGRTIVVSDPRLNARTGYGEKFNLQDYGGISSVQYVNGARQGARIINEKMPSNGRYRYGSSWNSKQQAFKSRIEHAAKYVERLKEPGDDVDTLNGRSMAWAVEDVRPDF